MSTAVTLPDHPVLSPDRVFFRDVDPGLARRFCARFAPFVVGMPVKPAYGARDLKRVLRVLVGDTSVAETVSVGWLERQCADDADTERAASLLLSLKSH